MYDADLTGDQRSNCYINMINNRIDRYINLFSDLSSKWQKNIQKTLKHKTVFSIHFAVFLLHSHKIFFKILTVTVATNFDIFPNSLTRISYVTWSFPLNKSYTNDSCIYIYPHHTGANIEYFRDHDFSGMYSNNEERGLFPNF